MIPSLRLASLAFLLLLCAVGNGVAAGGGLLVEAVKVVPELKVELRYATKDNFTHEPVYACARCFLRPGTAERLAKAQSCLAGRQLGLKVWDCYRPLSVQKRFWELVPGPRYVADPKKGSNHNRGSAVDVTLVGADGKELPMPTGFDDFSPAAWRGETNLPPQVLKNRDLLTACMAQAGFRPLETEWWHFDDPESAKELVDVTFADLCR